METKKTNDELGYKIVASPGRKITATSRKFDDRLIIMEVGKGHGRFETHVIKANGRIVTIEERNKHLPTVSFDLGDKNFYVEISHKIHSNGEEFAYYYVKNKNTHCIEYSYGKGGINFGTYDSPENVLFKFMCQKDPRYFFHHQYQTFTASEKTAYWVHQVMLSDRMQSGYPSKYKNPCAFFLCRDFMLQCELFDPEIKITIENLGEHFNVPHHVTRILLQYDRLSNDWIVNARKFGLYLAMK